MNYKDAKKAAEQGAMVTVIIIDELYHRHVFEYRKENFPDMSFGEFCGFFWTRFGSERSVISYR